MSEFKKLAKNFCEKHNLVATDENEKINLYDFYEHLKEDLAYFSKRRKSFRLGKISQARTKILGIVLKEFTTSSFWRS